MIEGQGVTKVALVTGGAKRIGRAIACHLHGLGFDIALHYHSSAESAQSLADELCSVRPGSCRLFRADLQDETQINAMSRELLACYPSIELLVNNASSYFSSPIDSSTPAQFDTLVGANLRGPYFLVQGLLPGLRSGSASIVNILDVHMDLPLRGFSVYGATKAALAALTRSLAVELGPEIRVNGVAPGAILWPEGDDSYDQTMREHTVQQTPLKRLGEPMDIARTVAFLACDAPFITGQLIKVDGGRSLVS